MNTGDVSASVFRLYSTQRGQPSTTHLRGDHACTFQSASKDIWTPRGRSGWRTCRSSLRTAGHPGCLVPSSISKGCLESSPRLVVWNWRFSRSKGTKRRQTAADVAEEIARLKREPGRDIYVTGGARLSQSLSQRGLIDEYNLTIHPILLGSGMPLFGEMSEELVLILVGTIPFESGAIHLIYQKA